MIVSWPYLHWRHAHPAYIPDVYSVKSAVVNKDVPSIYFVFAWLQILGQIVDLY